MLTGSIEMVTTEKISGWMYSSAVDLRGHTVLAFRGQRCIGAGAIGVFRSDLHDAGLGHGCFGYDFEIASDGTDATCGVYVRLDTSEAIFIQPGTALVSRTESASAPPPNAVSPAAGSSRPLLKAPPAGRPMSDRFA